MKRNTGKWLWAAAVIAAFLFTDMMSVAARADIEVKPQYEPNEPIVATVTITDVPEGAKLRGSFAVSDGSYLTAGENVYHIWAAPGKHTVTSAGVWVLTQEVVVGDQKLPVLVDFGQFSYTRTFTVGEVPDPPDPPDPPKPGGPYQLMMFYSADQLDNLPASQRLLLTSLKLRQQLVSAGHVVHEMVETEALNGPVPDRYKAFFGAVRGDPLPRLAYAPKAGGAVVDIPLPQNTAELLEVLR